MLGLCAKHRFEYLVESGIPGRMSPTSIGSGVSFSQRKSQGAPAAVRNSQPFVKWLAVPGLLLSCF